MGAAALHAGVLGLPSQVGLMPLILSQHEVQLIPKYLMLTLESYLCFTLLGTQLPQAEVFSTWDLLYLGCLFIFSEMLRQLFYLVRFSYHLCLYFIKWFWKHFQYSNDLRKPAAVTRIDRLQALVIHLGVLPVLKQEQGKVLILGQREGGGTERNTTCYHVKYFHQLMVLCSILFFRARGLFDI